MKKRINEKQLNRIIKESVKKVLKEGTTDDEVINKWYDLLKTIGAFEMLSCIFSWSSSDQLEQYIRWFEQEGYFNNDGEDY